MERQKTNNSKPLSDKQICELLMKSDSETSDGEDYFEDSEPDL